MTAHEFTRQQIERVIRSTLDAVKPHFDDAINSAYAAGFASGVSGAHRVNANKGHEADKIESRKVALEWTLARLYKINSCKSNKALAARIIKKHGLVAKQLKAVQNQISKLNTEKNIFPAAPAGSD